MPIDFHVHVFPDQLAQKAVQNIFQITKNPPSTDGTLSDTLAHMDQWNVNHAVIQHISTKPTQQTAVNHWAAQIQNDRIFCLGSVFTLRPQMLSRKRHELRNWGFTVLNCILITKIFAWMIPACSLSMIPSVSLDYRFCFIWGP